MGQLVYSEPHLPLCHTATSNLVSAAGVEPARLSPQASQTCASANSATPRKSWCARPESNRDARGQQVLSLPRLPVPPRARRCRWSAARESNPHALRHRFLSAARLPVPPAADEKCLAET